MATNAIRKFQTIDLLMSFLNGAVLGNEVRSPVGSPAMPGLQGLVGATLTLIGSGPTGTVTFIRSNIGSGSAVPPGTNPDPYTLLFKDIKAQIESAIAGTLVTMATGRLQIAEATPSHGITIAAGSAGGYPTVVGTVDLNTLSYGAGGTLDGLVLNLKHDGGSTLTTTFSAPVNRADVIAQINAVTLTDITASINGANQLVLTAPDQGASHNISVLAGTADLSLGLTVAVTTGAATNTANTILGFDGTNNTVGQVYVPVEVSNSAPCWVWAESDNNGSVAVFTWE